MPGNIEHGSNKESAEHEAAREIYRTSLQKALSEYGITPQVREAIEGSPLDLPGVRPENIVALSFESPIDLSDIPLPDKIAEFFRSQGKEEMSNVGIKSAHLGISVAYLEMRSESKLNIWSFDLRPQLTFRKYPIHFTTPANVVRSLAEIAMTIAERPYESSVKITHVVTDNTPEHNPQRRATNHHGLYNF